MSLTPVNSSTSPKDALNTGTLPKETPLGQVFVMREDLKKVGESLQRLDLGQLRDERDKLNGLALEKIRAQRHRNHLIQHQDAWSHRSTLFSVITAGVTMASGIHLARQHRSLHAAIPFIVGGAFSTLNTALSYGQTWNWITQKLSGPNGKYAPLITKTAQIFGYAIPIICTIWGAKILKDNRYSFDTIWTVVDLAFQGINQLLQINDLYYGYRKMEADAHLVEIQSKTTAANHKVTNITQHRQHTTDLYQDIGSTLKKTFTNEIRTRSAAAR